MNPEWKPNKSESIGYGWCINCLKYWISKRCFHCGDYFDDSGGRCQVFKKIPVCDTCSFNGFIQNDLLKLQTIMANG